MNKLLTKIVGIALGATMAIGVGVAIASTNRETSPANAAATTVTYTVTGTSSVSSSGTVPTGAGKSYSQTYGTQSQATSGNSMTFTLTGYSGKTISSVKTSLHRNSTKGTGSVTVKNNGSTVKTNTYVRADLTSSYREYEQLSSSFDVTGDIVVLISATENSLFCDYIKVTWDESVDTLNSIAVNSGATSTFKDGDKFAFDGSITATYSKTGTTGHTNITSGLSFKIGDSTLVPGTTELARGNYTVVITYNDGTKSASCNWPITVGYHDAESVTIAGPSSLIVTKGYETTFVASVEPSNAENSVTWSVTDTENNDTDLAIIFDDTGEFMAGNATGTVRVWATSSDGLASSYVTVTISGDPLIELDKTSINAYSIDSPVSVTATPQNFPAGTVTYKWISNDISVATVPDVSTASNSISFVSGGSTTITVEGYVNSVKKAETSCSVTVTKTRSVMETVNKSGVYDFSEVTETGTRITDTSIGDVNDYFINTSTLDEPTLTLPSYNKDTTNYVYFGNGSGGAYANQGGFLKFGKSGKGGSIKFTFEETITSVTVSAQQWTSNGGEGEILINGVAPSSNAGASSYANVTASDLSTTEITISTADSSPRCFVDSITFYSAGTPTQIGRSADVVGLETFVDTYMHMDYDKGGTIGSTGGTGLCTGYYDKNGTTGAKYAFNQLNAHQRSLFSSNSAYTSEWNRLSEWARVNGDSLNGSNQLAQAAKFNPSTAVKENTGFTAMIVIVSTISLTAIGGYFFLRKRKEVK